MLGISLTFLSAASLFCSKPEKFLCLLGVMLLDLVYPGNPVSLFESWLHNLTKSAKCLWPCNITYSQVSGIRVWASSWSNYSVYRKCLPGRHATFQKKTEKKKYHHFPAFVCICLRGKPWFSTVPKDTCTSVQACSSSDGQQRLTSCDFWPCTKGRRKVSVDWDYSKGKCRTVLFSDQRWPFPAKIYSVI